MSEMNQEPNAQPAEGGPPPAPTVPQTPVAEGVWYPPPPLPPAPAAAPAHPWRWILAAVVTWAIIAGAGGIAIGFTLARSLSATHTAQVQTAAPSPTSSAAPIQAAPSPAANQNGSASAQAVAAKVDPAIVDIYTTVGSGQAAGTGMIITSSGEVLTNNHVVDGSTKIEVVIQGVDGTYTAHVIGADASADVALIQIEGVSGLPTVQFASSSSVQVGDAVVALGNALGQGGTPSLTEGNVTALDQTITASEGGSRAETLSGMIQSDAPISPGDSGGPLVNSAGQVVGMITAGEASGFTNSASTINYAVPSDNLLRVVNLIRSGQASSEIIYGQVGYMGVSVRDMTPAYASQLGLSQTSGALIVGVQPNSPAQKAGIPQDSVITSVGGASVTSSATLGTVLHSHRPGDRVSVTYVSSSGTHTVTVTLGAVNP
jgi:S1-C subfamily serine protease